MRVLSVVVEASARSGGVAAFAGGAARALEELGHEVPVVATDLTLPGHGWWQRGQGRAATDDLHPDLCAAGVRLHPARMPRRMGYSPALRRTIRAEIPSVDLVHIHGLWQYPQLTASLAARAGGVPYVVSIHGMLDHALRRVGRGRKALTMLAWQRRMLAGARAIHVTTQAEFEAIADVAPRVPRFVVPCGITVAEFAGLSDRRTFREQELGGYDGPLITFLGRIAAKKRVDLLISAFAEVRSRSECRLVIAGADDYGLRPAMETRARALGVEAHVAFVGPMFGTRRQELLAATDVWALPSQTENFGIAVVEAAAAGCALVVSEGVGVAPDIDAGGAGLVVEPEVRPLTAALSRLLDDDGERARLGVAAARFAKRYDWSQVGPDLVTAYERAIADARPGPEVR